MLVTRKQYQKDIIAGMNQLESMRAQLDILRVQVAECMKRLVPLEDAVLPEALPPRQLHDHCNFDYVCHGETETSQASDEQ